MTLNEAVKTFTSQLQSAKIENPLRETRLLIAFALDKTYEEIFFSDDFNLSESKLSVIQDLVTQRLNHKPLAKIIQQKEFWGISFIVTEDTLDPRPESESLIEEILYLQKDRQETFKILDLGTGSGCLLLTLLTLYPKATGLGIDISSKALQIAEQNARHLKLLDRCQFQQSSWFDNLTYQKWDIIISNPPYIPEGTELSTQTLYDPKSALFASENGLKDYRLILETAHEYLTTKGFLVFEIGYDQKESVIDMATKKGYRLLSERKDLLGHTRCLVFQYAQSE